MHYTRLVPFKCVAQRKLESLLNIVEDISNA